METAPVRRTSARYVYSDKIEDRRRSLFPDENTVDNSDLDHMSPLSSDGECGINEGVTNENVNVATNASTKYIRDMLSTPKSNNYPPSEQSMSPLYLSPYTQNEQAFPHISPTKQLKTPNDSIVLTPNEIPKLSRKSTPNDIPTSHTQSKSSKVRTSLFPEIEVSLAPKQFYPKSDTLKTAEFKITRAVNTRDKGRTKKKQTKSKKRLSGQINAGVQHKIKKPKERKPEVILPNALFTKIKTGKDPIEPRIERYLEVLEDSKKSKEIKLIQRIPEQSSNLKRPSNETNESIPKHPKLDATLDSDESTLEDDEELENAPNINDVLEKLNDIIEEDKENNSNKAEEMLLSPTSEMCNMTSVMKIDSPKKSKNLKVVFQNMAGNQEADQNQTESAKLFPIFYPNHKTANKRVKDNFQMEELNNRRKRIKISSDQMLLDAGQKRFGLTECAECNYVYHAGDPKDEKLHEDRHNATSILRFAGWKNEHVVENLPNGGRVIEILPGDSKIWIEKAKKIVEVINREMGYQDLTMDPNFSKVYLYIIHKQVIGCLVADVKTEGYKLLPSDADVDMCSTEHHKVQCGVSRLWVLSQFRRKGVATKLMEILKLKFMKGRRLENSDIAFSTPTPDGKLFATKYMQTPNFLIYFD